jgi:predicted HTH domain antitoxin
MSQSATMHVKVEPVMIRGLKSLARSRKRTMGDLVRAAVIACYQSDLLGLTQHQTEALAAYRGGYISLGKLAECMGMSVLKTRTWLAEHDIVQSNAYHVEDAQHA